MAAQKKPLDLSGLVATKGSAAPVAGVAQRTAPAADEAEAKHVPLNFKISGELKRRFRRFAADHDLKLNELLKLAFEEYEQRHGGK